MRDHSQIHHAGLRQLIRTALLLVAVLLQQARPASGAGTETRGHLVIIGGGNRTAQIMERFTELAGGERAARIIIIPLASSVPDTTGMEMESEFRARGVASVEWLVFTRPQADDEAFCRKFDGTTGVFFSGGDQIRITKVIAGTRLQAKLKALYRSGTVIGGTSAGAAIMSSVMLTGNELINKDSTRAYSSIMRGNIETVEGLGFLDSVIIDQHFIKRRRLNRLISVVLEHPRLPGIGIDESTALQANPDGSFEVLGEGSVIVFDARAAGAVHSDGRGHLAARGIGMHIFFGGERFDLDHLQGPSAAGGR